MLRFFCCGFLHLTFYVSDKNTKKKISTIVRIHVREYQHNTP